MRCSLCRRIDRAVFTRLRPGREYLLLCGVCLDRSNVRIADELQQTSLHARHATQASSLDKSGHFWRRLAGVFALPMRKIEIEIVR